MSNDIRDIERAADEGNAGAQLALDVVRRERAALDRRLFSALNGADAIVFTAGIGENRAELRAAICANLDQLGIVLDPHEERRPRRHAKP